MVPPEGLPGNDVTSFANTGGICMDVAHFDALTRMLAFRQSRRSVAIVLGAVATAILTQGEETQAGKKKKKPLCLNGQTIKASGNKRKKLLKQGASPGACAGSCTPRCDGTSCGGDDGCGGACGCSGNAVCNGGTCMPCTVVCTGTPLGCGSQLTQALLDGGTIALCPGTYSAGAGVFEIRKDTTLVGAGPEDDPGSNTILDGEGARLVLFANTSRKLTMHGLRVINGFGGQGGGMLAGEGTDVRVTNCAFVQNTGNGGGAILSFGNLRLTNTLFDQNEATNSDGGGVLLIDSDQSFVTNCTFTGNTSGMFGGGLSANNSQVTITGTEFRDNTADRGGGLSMDGGTVNLDSATLITGNVATELGGGAVRFSGVLNRNGATISGNSAPRQPDCAGGCT